MSKKQYAFIGKMHSGKSTVAKFLVEQGFMRVAFADPVKAASAEMLTTLVQFINPETATTFTIDDMNNIKGHPAIRKLLQLVGTELGREWHGPESLWIDMFEQVVLGYAESNDDVRLVNDDCRFPNEAERLSAMGFTLVKLVRDEQERIESVYEAVARDNPALEGSALDVAVDEILSHPSESNVDLIVPDITLESTGLRELEQYARDINNYPQYAFLDEYREIYA